MTAVWRIEFVAISPTAHSSRGPGRRPLTAVTRVQIPYALPTCGTDSEFGAPPSSRSRRTCENNSVQFDDVKAVLAALATEEVEYVLVGGVTVGLHGFERATNDIDLFVRTSEENIDRLRRALDAVFHDPAIAEISASDLAGEYPTIRYGPPDADFVIDLLGGLGSAFLFDDLEFEMMEIEGILVRVATALTLYRMKRGTVLPIDRVDAEVLRDAFGFGEDD